MSPVEGKETNAKSNHRERRNDLTFQFCLIVVFGCFGDNVRNKNCTPKAQILPLQLNKTHF